MVGHHSFCNPCVVEVMDKVVVSHRAALIGKYGVDGLAKIEDALLRLTTVDAKRGVQTGRIYIDDETDMNTVGGTRVTNVEDEIGTKKAIDAIAGSFELSYLVLLGSPDVIPHISLANPLPQDGDPDVPSDLPYASPGPYSRSIADHLVVTRVVSRIPGVTGSKDPDFLVAMIDRSSDHAPRSPSDYGSYFAISTDTWTSSTQLSLNRAFGNSTTLKLAPPEAQPAIDQDLVHLAHFINCHGVSLQPKYFGQKDNRVSVSMEGALLAGNVKGDTIVSAECCYGAQLYDHVLAGRGQPLCLSYLEHGAIGFVGSTNISYGLRADNGAADLLTQFFWINLLKSVSLGRAFLQARQDFIQRERMADPTNLKTIGQFILLGDASTHPCLPPPRAAMARASGAIDATLERRAMRLALDSNGRSIADSATAMGSRAEGHGVLLARVRDLAHQEGMENPEIATYHVSGGNSFLSAAKASGSMPFITVAVEVKKAEDGPDVRVMVAHSLQRDGEHGISSLRNYVSR
jgi:hypothetical protein